MINETPRQEVLRLWGDMEKERDLLLSVYCDIADYVMPERGRYLRRPGMNPTQLSAQNFGADIVDSVATRSLRTAASGIMSSLTNPARPWFRITTADPMLAELGSVRGYLFQVEKMIQWVFSRSNIHNELHTLYRDLFGFGTGPLHIDESARDVIRAYVLPVGQYALACDAEQRVDTSGRLLSPTVRQLVERFCTDPQGNVDLTPLTKRTRRLYERGELNQRIQVLHLVAPNRDFRAGALAERGMRWRSLWMEQHADREEGFLAVRGYRQFPVAAARWELTGTEEVYGHSPVREVLPDVKQLQHVDSSKVGLIDLSISPPTQGPAGADLPSTLAGAWNPLPAAVSGNAKIERLWDTSHADVQEARVSVQELEMRIREGLYEDLWKLLISRDSQGRPPSMTATEVAQRQEEKLTLLGPFVDRIHNELLSPLIRRTISILAERRLLPPPPRELVQALVSGEDVRIEYQSVLAQAQRLLGLGSLERFASIALTLAKADPTVMDKIDPDEMLDQAADMLGVPPSIVRPDDQVAEIRISRAKQQERVMQMQQMAEQAKATKDLGTTPLGQDSPLSRLLSAYGPSAVGTQVSPPGVSA